MEGNFIYYLSNDRRKYEDEDFWVVHFCRELPIWSSMLFNIWKSVLYHEIDKHLCQMFILKHIVIQILLYHNILPKLSVFSPLSIFFSVSLFHNVIFLLLYYAVPLFCNCISSSKYLKNMHLKPSHSVNVNKNWMQWINDPHSFEHGAKTNLKKFQLTKRDVLKLLNTGFMKWSNSLYPNDNIRSS